MTYKSVIVTQYGGPEVLQVVENKLREPDAGEARVRVLATGVGGTDIHYRYGRSPLSPKVPFVPGYEIVGVVDAIGPGVTRAKVGDCIAALTGTGGYSEMIYLGQEHLVPVPPSLDTAEAAVVVLNYVTAYQMLHRVAKVKAGEVALVIGASGGVGTALLQLGKLAGLKLYGTASASKQGLLSGLGAIPIDYRVTDVLQAIHQAEPGGIDLVFDGVGGKTGEGSQAVLRRGGRMVSYAAPVGIGSMLLGAIKMVFNNVLPNGKTAAFYGITALYMRDKKPFMEDLPLLFNLLVEEKIKPVITARLPLLEARKANELLESGQAAGNIVLFAPESAAYMRQHDC
jgi:NADPH:quinone reductase-like Zn-dependent oxidoreductase